ncbi:MAG: hypothetical protein HYY50_04000 [Candidatus Kerfeldbacteria bacterium]|nr:hypothetical protein [Candidatus Kerfeldbacteria bacterium]
MFHPSEPQPAGALVSVALADRGVYTKLRRPSGTYTLVGVNDCNDDRTYWNKKEEIERVVRCLTLPVPFFGGITRLSPRCPDYRLSDARFMLGEFRTAVEKRGIRIFFAGAHGEECGWCAEEGVTVAQRQWLSRDGQRVILRAAEEEQWTPEPIRVCITWHRRYDKLGREHQKTRVIACRHSLFDELPITTVMRSSDRQFLERVAPGLLDLVAA